MQPLEIDSAVFCDGARYTIISRENSSILTCPVASGAGGYTLNRVEGRDIDLELDRLTGHAACIAVDVPTWCRIAGDPLDAVADALADLLCETPTRFELERLAAASPVLTANTPGIPVFPAGIAPAANSYTLAGCCRSALVRGLSSPELYRTALTAAGAAISGARRIAANSPDSIASTDSILTATIGIGGTDTAEIGAICADVLEDGNLLIEGAAWPISEGEDERAFFGFEDTAEDPRNRMREVPAGADGAKRLADAALAASCATLSPNTADPCLVARLAAEARERSLSLTDPETQARGAKRAAGSTAQGEAAGRGPALSEYLAYPIPATEKNIDTAIGQLMAHDNFQDRSIEDGWETIGGIIVEDELDLGLSTKQGVDFYRDAFGLSNFTEAVVWPSSEGDAAFVMTSAVDSEDGDLAVYKIDAGLIGDSEITVDDIERLGGKRELCVHKHGFDGIEAIRAFANRVAVDRFDERFGVNNLYGDLPDLAPTLRKVTEDARTAVQQPRDPQAIAAAALSAAEGGAKGAVELVGNKR